MGRMIGWVNLVTFGAREAPCERPHSTGLRLCKVSRRSKSRDRRQIGGCEGLVQGGEERLLMGMGSYFEGMKIFWI